MAKPPLPATIRWAIVFLALQTAGVLFWVARLFPGGATGLGLMWLSAALAAIGGLVGRRPLAWAGAVGLCVGSVAVAAIVLGTWCLWPGALSDELKVRLGCGAGFVLPLILLLAGRRDDLDLAGET